VRHRQLELNIDGYPRLNMLQVTELECVRGERKLFSHLSFSLAAGTLLHVQGANGSGKTTLLKIIAGLMQPQVGTVLWRNENTRLIREDFNRELMYLGHVNGIKADLTAIENLRIAAILSGIKIPESAIWQALNKIGLAGVEDLPIKMLSQGQKRRVALAQLLIKQVPLWILDEPFVGLDSVAIDLVLRIIAAHLAKNGLVILTTHQDLFLAPGVVQYLKLGK